MSWSAHHDEEHELEHGRESIEPPEPEPTRAAAPLHKLASDVGNRAFGGAIARAQGAGIMPDGEVHPDVQSKIDSTRGSGASAGRGRRTTSSRRRSATSRMSACIPTTTADTTSTTRSRRARSRPAPTSTSPRTSTSPNTSDGDKLIAHELAHVVQQRGAPTSGPLTVSNPGDAMENEADAVADIEP